MHCRAKRTTLCSTTMLLGVGFSAVPRIMPAIKHKPRANLRADPKLNADRFKGAIHGAVRRGVLVLPVDSVLGAGKGPEKGSGPLLTQSGRLNGIRRGA